MKFVSQQSLVITINALEMTTAMIVFGIVLLNSSCGYSTKTKTGGGTDSSTHWLKRCDHDGDCDSLECLCGVCTIACSGNSDCDATGLSATCERSAGRDCSTPRDVAVCVAECDKNSDCTKDELKNKLGLSCVQGQCIPADAPESDAGLVKTNIDSSSPGEFDPCRPMDARSSDDGCTLFTGWTFNGTECEPVICGCRGTDCESIYSTAQQCQEAYATCIDDVYTHCGASYECISRTKACCSPCGRLDLEDFIFIRTDSLQSYRDTVCEPDGGCDPCTNESDPYIVPFCEIVDGASDGLCTAINLNDYSLTECEVDSDCTLVPPRCCACSEPASNWIAISDQDEYNRLMCTVPPGYESPTHPPVDDCSEVCTPVDSAVTARCQDGRCANPASFW